MPIRLHVGDADRRRATDRLLDEDQRPAHYDAALRFLGVRPRSEREIRDRLARHEFAPQIVDRVIERLRAASTSWTTPRSPSTGSSSARTHRPRGGRLLKQELRLKGVDVEVAAAALPADDDETDGAYRAATRKAQSLRLLDERTFRQRLGAFLQRRGFSYETVDGGHPTLERASSGPADELIADE